MKVKYLMNFFEGLPRLQTNIHNKYPRHLFLGTRYFFKQTQALNSKQFVFNNY